MTGTPTPTLFFGGVDSDANILEWGEGFVDGDGAVLVDVLAKSDPIAPAGASGEAIFKNIYLTVTFDMTVDLIITPIIDFVTLDGTAGAIPPGYAGVVDERLTLSLVGGAERVTERFEIGLSLPYPDTANERLRTAMRGAWFQVMVSVEGGLAAGDLILEQVELEFENVRESVVAST